MASSYYLAFSINFYLYRYGYTLNCVTTEHFEVLNNDLIIGSIYVKPCEPVKVAVYSTFPHDVLNLNTIIPLFNPIHRRVADVRYPR